MSHQVGNTFVISGVKHRKHKEPKDVWLLRPIQQEMADQLSPARLRRILAATGSGKSISMQWLACGDQKDGLTPVLTFPKLDILAGFSKRKTMKDARTGERRVWDPVSMTDKPTVQRLIDHLRSGSTRPVLCTAATWLLAQKQLTDHDLAKVSLFVDESHHLEAESEDSTANRLHDSTMRVKRLRNTRVTLGTATWLRSEGSDVLTEDELQDFTTYHLPLTRYLREVAEIERVHFTFALASEEESLQVSLKEGRPMMYFARTGQSPSAKLKANRKVIRAARAAGRTILDLVDDSDLQARAAKLAAFDEAEQERVDFVSALFMGNEGFDWRRAQEAFFARPRRSLRSMVQMIGRVLRYSYGKTDVYITICIPFDAKEDKIKEYFDVLIATAVLSCQFAEVSIGPRSPGGPHTPRSAAWKLLHDESFLLGVFPKLETAVLTGATDVELYGMLRKVQTKYPVLEDTAVRGDLVSLLRQSLGGGVPPGTAKDKNEAQCLNVPGADQIESPIVLERVRSLVHDVEMLCGKATRDALEQVRLKRPPAYDPADAEKWVYIAQQNGLTATPQWMTFRNAHPELELPSQPWRTLGITLTEFFALVNGFKFTKGLSKKERTVEGKRWLLYARKHDLTGVTAWNRHRVGNPEVRGLPAEPWTLLDLSSADFFARVRGVAKSTRTMSQDERKAEAERLIALARKHELTNSCLWKAYAREHGEMLNPWKLLDLSIGDFFTLVNGRRSPLVMSLKERASLGRRWLAFAKKHGISTVTKWNDHRKTHPELTLPSEPWELLGITIGEFFAHVNGFKSTKAMSKRERATEGARWVSFASSHNLSNSTHWKLYRAQHPELRMPACPWYLLDSTCGEFFALVRVSSAEAAE
jgi:hypothetical protein